MNWDQIQGKWTELKGELRSKWADMTDSDFEKIGGKKDELVGWLQKKYGYAKDRAHQEADAFGRELDERDAETTNPRPIQ